jgi:hypothetical protein
MSILDSVLSAGGGTIVNQLASRFGINTEQATSTISTLVPAIAGGMKEKIANNDPTVANLLTGDRMTQFAQNLTSLDSPAATETGNNLISGIFNQGETNNLISTVAEKAGIGSDTVGKILPVVATFVGGFASKSAAAGGNLTDTLTELSEIGHGGLLGAVKSLASKMLG